MNASTPLITSLIWGGLFLISGGYVLALAIFGKEEPGLEEKPDPLRIFSILLGLTVMLVGAATLVGGLL